MAIPVEHVVLDQRRVRVMTHVVTQWVVHQRAPAVVLGVACNAEEVLGANSPHGVVTRVPFSPHDHCIAGGIDMQLDSRPHMRRRIGVLEMGGISVFHPGDMFAAEALPPAGLDGITVDSQNGRIIFTTIEPFGSHLFEKLDNTRYVCVI